MAKLPPLRVPKRAPWMNRHKEPDKPREIPDGFPGAADLKNLVKQTVELQNVNMFFRYSLYIYIYFQFVIRFTLELFHIIQARIFKLK